jgi:Transposase
MNVLHERCAGLDVHKETVVACRRVMESATATREVRSFPSTTRGLLVLADWLREAGCTHVAMEATGVYWKPVWHVLEATVLDFKGSALPTASRGSGIEGRIPPVDLWTTRRRSAVCGGT